MTQPQLYQPYATEKIVSFFALREQTQSFCNGQWLFFPKIAICLANVGKGPNRSFFENGSHFYWVVDQPYYVNGTRNPAAHVEPARVVDSAGRGRSIHLFARPADSQEFLYVGELEPSHMWVPPVHSHHGMARFALRPALPSALWVRFGGRPLGNLDFTPVDRALDVLRGPTTVQDRLGVLQQLVDFWHGPIKPEDGFSEAELAGIHLPMPLRWWYRWAGKRDDIMSGHEHPLQAR